VLATAKETIGGRQGHAGKDSARRKKICLREKAIVLVTFESLRAGCLLFTFAVLERRGFGDGRKSARIPMSYCYSHDDRGVLYGVFALWPGLLRTRYGILGRVNGLCPATLGGNQWDKPRWWNRRGYGGPFHLFEDARPNRLDARPRCTLACSLPLGSTVAPSIIQCEPRLLEDVFCRIRSHR